MNDFDTVNMNKLQKAVYYFREYGFEYTKNRALKKLGIPVPEESEYMNWLRKRRPGKRELQEQKEKRFPFMPVIDVIIDETSGLLCGSSLSRETLAGNSAALKRSLKNQTYGRIGEVAAARGEDSLEPILKRMKGEVVVFAQADTILAPELFFEYVKAMNEHAEAQLLYTDEDCGTADGKRRFRPYFKPDISPELLFSFQYIGGVFAVRRAFVDEILNTGDALPDVEPFGNYWYDLLDCGVEFLRNREEECKAPDDIGTVHPRGAFHIPFPLFTKVTGKDFKGFWRILSGDQISFVKKHMNVLEREGEVRESEVPGFARVKWALPEEKPLVSILIPNKDHTADLEKCVRALLEKNDYPSFEIIIAENNSTEKETFAYYEKVTGKAYDPNHPSEGLIRDASGEEHRVVVATWKSGDTPGFNYSGINNYAVGFAGGELLLLLNNDTELRDREALSELVSAVLLPGVGGAGAMLYYDDGTIQHGGVVYKIGGFAANALWSLTDRDEQYYPYSVTEREMSCCTAACLMLRREAFEAAGGFDEKLAVALNDVDLCLKVRRAGYKIIFNPYARLYHYESKSRGSEEESKEKQDRFNREIAYFQSKWQEEIDRGDPYYNVNQTLHYANYSLELAEDNRGRYQA